MSIALVRACRARALPNGRALGVPPSERPFVLRPHAAPLSWPGSSLPVLIKGLLLQLAQTTTSFPP